jgi:hypothetical protein
LVVAGGVEDQIAEQFTVAALMILMLRSWTRIRGRVRAWVRPTPMWCRRPATRNVTEPASSTRSQLDAVVSVGAGAGVCFGSGLVDRGGGGSVGQ